MQMIHQLVGLLLLLAAVQGSLGLHVMRVEGTAMQPTLPGNTYVLCRAIDAGEAKPERFQVVITRYPGREGLVFTSRVVALGGETVATRDGQLLIDGVRVETPFACIQSDIPFGPVTLPDDTFFVMGDNRPISNDSRSPQVGPLPLAMLEAVVMGVLW